MIAKPPQTDIARSAEPPNVADISINRAVRAIYDSLSTGLKRTLFLTAGLTIAGTVAELISIGAVLPFIAMLTNPGLVEDLPVVGAALAQNPPSLAETAGVLIAAILSAALIRLAMSWTSQKFSFGLAHDVGLAALRKVTAQPYAFHVGRNSADLIAKFEMIQSLTYSIFMAAVIAAVSTFVALFIILFLMLVDPVVSLGTAVVLAGLYILISILVRSRLGRNSAIVSHRWHLRTRKVTEALNGVRDILLDASQGPVLADFSATDRQLRRAQAVNWFLNAAPRIVIEAAAMAILVALTLLIGDRPGGIMASLPILGALAIGAQRLLPLLQNAYAGWSQLVGGGQAVREIAQLLLLPDPGPTTTAPPLSFEREIRLEDVGFAYPGSAPTLHNVTLTIAKGDRVGIMGKTGSGKSTLTDLLMGLLIPTAGVIRVDGVALDETTRPGWHRQIAHVPQSIYLVDDSVAANIALGWRHGEIDMDKVRHAARLAGVAEFIEDLPGGYGTLCGERGLRFSGGQRQRIGIARALYKDAQVLLLDEATSALDTATEREVVESIAALDETLTIIIVAHRATSLTLCNRLIEVAGGVVTELDQMRSAAVARDSL